MYLIVKTHLTKECYIKPNGFNMYQTAHTDNDAKLGSVIMIRDLLSHCENHMMQRVEVQLSTKQHLKMVGLFPAKTQPKIRTIQMNPIAH